MAESVLEQAESIIERREREAFEKAEKVAAKDWTGEYVYSERFQEIFDDIDDLLERHADMEEEPPEYVWECEEEALTLDAESILQDAMERQEMDEDIVHISHEAGEELQALLDGWLKKHPVKWWREVHKRAVLLREDG